MARINIIGSMVTQPRSSSRMQPRPQRHEWGSRNGDRTQDVDSTKRSRKVAQLGLFDTASRTLLPEMKVI